MIQIRCSKCKMLFNIDENQFIEQDATIFNLKCLSCGEEIPKKFIDHINQTIDINNDESSWKIGTYLDEQ